MRVQSSSHYLIHKASPLSRIIPIPESSLDVSRNFDSLQGVPIKRSRKHRLIEERNTEIEKSNRMLFERIRKIKMKNIFQSEKNLPVELQDSRETLETLNKPLSLPQVASAMDATQSQLASILADRKTFVDKYFQQIHSKGNLTRKTEELGMFLCHGWKVKVLLLDDQHVILKGRRGKQEVTKKYIYSKVKAKIDRGLEDWVNFKFEFQV